MPVFSATIKSLRRFIPSLIIHLGLFLLFASLFAYFGADTTSEIFRESELNVTVVDLEDSENSRGLIRFLSEDEKVTVEKRKSLNLEDRQKLNDSVRFDVSDFVLILPKDFSEKLKAGDDHAAEYMSTGDTASGELLSHKISSYLKDVMIYLNSGHSEKEAGKLAAKQLADAAKPDVRIAKTSTGTSDPYIQSVFTFLAYSLLTTVTLSVAMILIYMRERDLYARISVSGTSFFTRYAGMAGAVLFVAIGLCVVLIGFALYLTRSDPSITKAGLYILNAFALMPVGIGFAFLISSFTHNEGLVNMLTTMLLISMCFISGVFVPSEFMAEKVVAASHYLPLYWYVHGVELITTSSAGSYPGGSFTLCLIVQLLFASAFFSAGIVISRKKELYAV